MAEKTYTEQQNIKYKKKLNELLDILPDFCTQYFDSLEFNKQPRTKIAYAMDIKGFFEFLIECIPKFSSYAMKDFKPQDLEKIDGTDITRYLRHVKLYKKNGRDITNSESAAKRKLCALRRFYEYYCLSGSSNGAGSPRSMPSITFSKSFIISMYPYLFL